MELYQINPLSDRRWDDLVATHLKASAFHHRGWLEALALTYGYRPLVLTSTPAGRPLKDGVVFCQVESWITGTRMVSLPFSDHCEPLLNENSDYSEFAGWMRAERDRGHWKYVELRPLSARVPSMFPFEAGPSFWFHRLDLTPTIEQIFQRVHKSSIQRSIRRAEREQLSYERGRSGQLLDDFYRLQMITRRRHLLLPQPRGWFDNLIRCIGPNLTIRVARKKGDPIAALLTLRHRSNIIYKYGCSDKRFHHLSAMPLLFWKMIEESKADGAQQIDLGRTDLENHGLTVFKDRFGTVRTQLNYFRYPGSQSGTILLAAARRLFSALPDTLFSGAGRLVYRHLG
jgi:CelD/BcsL family acetyltransferase involved in cellulose biosynthesis